MSKEMNQLQTQQEKDTFTEYSCWGNCWIYDVIWKNIIVRWKEKTSAMNLCFPSVLKTNYPGTADCKAKWGDELKAEN